MLCLAEIPQKYEIDISSGNISSKIILYYTINYNILSTYLCLIIFGAINDFEDAIPQSLLVKLIWIINKYGTNTIFVLILVPWIRNSHTT